MASTPSMVTYETRLHSFNQITKPKSKAKPPFPLSSTSYPHLTPANLATAGFFHDPGEDEESWDTCRCFLCGLKLGGWDETDDPFEEHVKRGSCAWAEFVCQPQLHRAKGTDFTWDTPESLPSSAESSTWRESTFMKAWPHKSKTGWLPTVKRLAQAGFVLNASTMSKDAVVCPLCEYSVEGWEATDDPWSIHMNKSPGCRFFTAQVAPQTKSACKVSKPKAKRSQRKTEATTLAEALEESEVDHEEPEPEPSTSQPKARRARAKSRGRNKAGKGTDLESQSAMGEEIVETEASDVEMEPPTVPAEKPTRGKGKGRGKAKVTEDADTESQAEIIVVNVLDSAAESPAEAVETKKTTKKGGRKTITSKSRSKPTATAPSDAPSASEAEIEYIDAIVPVPESDAEGSKTVTKSTSTRARRQTQTQKASSSRSKSSRKTITSLDDIRDDVGEPSGTEMGGTDVGGTTNDEEEQAPKSQKGGKRPRGRTMKSGKTRAQAEETESEVPASEAEQVSAAPAPLAKSTSSRAKSAKAKKVAQAQVEETESESVAESVVPSEAESVSAPSKSKSSSSRVQTGTIKTKTSKTRSAPSRLHTDTASEAEQVEEAPATVKKATRKPAKAKQDVVVPPSPPAQPRVLSQLERFANIPPSSPMSLADPMVDHETPRAKPPLVSAKPARPSPHANLPREQLDKSVAQGAVEARRVMHELVANIAGGGGEGEGHQQGKLTEEQKKMTLEELVRSEYRKQHQVMKSQGEEMIAMWEEKARQARRKIELL